MDASPCSHAGAWENLSLVPSLNQEVTLKRILFLSSRNIDFQVCSTEIIAGGKLYFSLVFLYFCGCGFNIRRKWTRRA